MSSTFLPPVATDFFHTELRIAQAIFIGVLVGGLTGLVVARKFGGQNQNTRKAVFSLVSFCTLILVFCVVLRVLS